MADEPVKWTDEEHLEAGPAQERRSRAPIKFKSIPGDKLGGYDPPNLLDVISNLFTGSGADKGSIVIDPAKNAQNGTTTANDIHHEAAHALLQPLMSNMIAPLGSSQMEDINASIPAYKQIAAKFQAFRGNSQTEIPAYAAGHQADFLGVPQDWMDQYTQQLTKKLLTLNPAIAKRYQSLVSASQPVPGVNYAGNSQQ